MDFAKCSLMWWFTRCNCLESRGHSGYWRVSIHLLSEVVQSGALLPHPLHEAEHSFMHSFYTVTVSLGEILETYLCQAARHRGGIFSKLLVPLALRGGKVIFISAYIGESLSWWRKDGAVLSAEGYFAESGTEPLDCQFLKWSPRQIQVGEDCWVGSPKC